jgi:hypothetical protein
VAGFLETDLAALEATEGVELIIPDAVEVFMGGIRTYCAASIQFWINVFSTPEFNGNFFFRAGHFLLS